MTPAIGNCERCASELERGDLRCAVCGSATPVAADSGEDRPEALKIHRCEGCSAAVSYDIEQRAPLCAFCDSVMQVETVEDPLEQTEAWLPFSVSAVEAQQALRRWTGSRGFFAPRDLQSEARLDSLQPLWWVGWMFEATAEICWAADSDAGSDRSRWAPHSGATDMVFQQLVVSASRGLSAAEADALIPSYDLASAQSEALLEEGVEPLIEHFEVQRSVARQRIAAAIRGTAAGRVEAGHIPGRRFRKVAVSVLLRQLHTERLGFPAYILAYRYRKKLFRVVISGQDAGYLHGRAPISIGRVLLVVLGAALLIAGIVGIVVLVSS